MPDFANKLEEEERWDVINYLHAMSRGYQARLMNPNIVPNQPSLGPPGFSYSAHDGSSGILKDFRQKKQYYWFYFHGQTRERALIN